MQISARNQLKRGSEVMVIVKATEVMIASGA